MLKVVDACSTPSPTKEDDQAHNPDRPRLLKTFTGCFTCRSRKIKCDMKKPQCASCTKSGLICAGYDIKLKWSLPIDFMHKNGRCYSKQAVFKPEKEEVDNGSSQEFFQRRNVGFVIWDAEHSLPPYETYEDIDEDLNSLGLPLDGEQNLGENETSTRIIGPFGVFQAQRPRKRKLGRIHSPESRRRVEDASKVISSDPAHPIYLWNQPPSVAENPIVYKAISSPHTEMVPNDHFWLSKELRDDALLTAAALNGDTQFLDFTANETPINGGLFDSTSNVNSNGAGSTYTGASHLFDTNQIDFLNLVFHRNNASLLTPSTENYTNHELLLQSPMSMSNLLNDVPHNSDTLINPQNQHLYYSNYNNYYYNNPYQLNDNLEIHLHASGLISNEEEHTDYVADDTHAAGMPTSIMRIVRESGDHKLGPELCVPPNLTNSTPAMGMPSSALQVQPLTRYLLNYYVTQVADLMTVIPLTENPWKTIYFPRALMAIGELLALGKTSTAKNALLNGLLAVSAFNLQSKFPKHSDSMKYYLNLGIRLRNQASLFVKHLLGSSGVSSKSGIEHCVSSEKYKDVLCAVMTMISVDLVWGTMQDINFYIKWCGKVIRAKMKLKTKLSSKARILHRVFLSLKLIQDSTCLSYESIKTEMEASSGHYDLNKEMCMNQDDSAKQTSPLSANKVDSHNPSPSFVDKKLINTTKYDENFATDALYGLPNSLILLFSKTVELLRTNIYHKEKFLEQSDDFTAKVNKLNKDLINWKLDWSLFPGENFDSINSLKVDTDVDLKPVELQEIMAHVEDKSHTVNSFYSPMHEAIYHHIMSFYHALTIYFNRFIKEISPDRLQLKVAKTLHHLNAIQRLIANNEAAMIPLFWQGFIAGCEATLVELQIGFKKWGGDIAQYLGSYWGARQIMLEVWRRKRMNEARDSWVHVIHDWEMNLMLN